MEIAPITRGTAGFALEHAYDQVDYLSLRAYYEEVGGDRASFLASAVDMDLFIDGVAAMTDAVRARKRSDKVMKLSFDEWNVWYASKLEETGRPTDWEPAPRLIEDEYSVVDAVVVGNLLISLLKHSDGVDAACLASSSTSSARSAPSPAVRRGDRQSSTRSR